MRLMIMVLSLLTLTSCSPNDSHLYEEQPKPPATEQPDEPDLTKRNNMKITIGNSTFTATLATGETVEAFKAMLPLTLSMSDFNNNEKVSSLPNSLTTIPSNVGTIHTGEIMLYGSISLVVFYETFSTSYSYTRIGQIDNVAGLKSALGTGSVTIKFE